MKRTAHQITKQPNSRAAVTASWTDQMRRAGSVKITTETLEPGAAGALVPLIEGDEGDVFKTFSGLAEIAWEMGWRPKSLAAVLGMVVAEFKLPKGS